MDDHSQTVPPNPPSSRYSANMGIKRRPYSPPQAEYEEGSENNTQRLAVSLENCTFLATGFFFTILILLEIYVAIVLVLWSVMPGFLDAHVQGLKSTFFFDHGPRVVMP